VLGIAEELTELAKERGAGQGSQRAVAGRLWTGRQQAGPGRVICVNVHAIGHKDRLVELEQALDGDVLAQLLPFSTGSLPGFSSLV